jgi:hypothetical protein
MTDPTPLSPAALAVWSAFLEHSEWEVTAQEVHGVAAALRAAADQVVPLQLPPELDTQRPTVAWHAWNAEQQARFALLAIATELESQ